MAELNQLLESTLRKDPKKAAGAENRRKTQAFLARHEGERTAKLGESTGLGDLLTFLPAAGAAKALRAGSKSWAGVNALAFTSQFDDSKLGENVGDAMAAFPVFGAGAGRLASLSRRNLAKGKDLPFFGQGNISPKRQKSIEASMKELMTDSRVTNPQKTLDALNEFKGAWGGKWGNKPIPARQIADRMPSATRFYFDKAIAKEGYGGIDTLFRSKAPMDPYGKRVTKAEHLDQYGGDAVTGGRMNPTQIAPAKYTWEQKYLKGEQSPGGIERLNARSDVSWVPRAGETLQPGMKSLLDSPLYKQAGKDWTVGALGGAAFQGAGLLGGKAGPEGDQKAGLIVNSRNIGRLAQSQQEQLLRLSKRRPNSPEFNELEAVFAAKYPKIYDKANRDGGRQNFLEESGPAGTGGYSPNRGTIAIGAPKSGASSWNSPSANNISSILNTMGHEATHAVDAGRIGAINSLGTKNRIGPGHFTGTLDDTIHGFAQDNPLIDGIPGVKSLLKLQHSDDATTTLNRLRKLAPKYRKAEFEKTDTAPQYKYRSVSDEEYRNQPIEQRANQAGKTAEKSTTKLLEMLADPSMKRLSSADQKYKELLGTGVGAGVTGLAAANLPGPENDEQQAVVKPWTKFRRKVAIANTPEWYLREAATQPGSKPTSAEYFVNRAQNSSEMLPTPGNRRGGAYLTANRAGDPFHSAYSSYQHDRFGSAAPSEGGSSLISGKITPKNELKTKGGVDSFFGAEADTLLGAGAKSKFRYKNAEALNKMLPKSLRLNNKDISLAGIHAAGGAVAPGIAPDALGDLLLSKYLKKGGFDALGPRSKAKYARELFIPNESRWDKKPAFAADWKTIKKAVDSYDPFAGPRKKSVNPKQELEEMVKAKFAKGAGAYGISAEEIKAIAPKKATNSIWDEQNYHNFIEGLAATSKK